MRNAGRTVLYQQLPLKKPFLVQIFPVYGCNFRCGYCLHALPRSRHGFISNTAVMEMSVYRRCIDSLAAEEGKIRMLRFAGIGEPLLHPELPEMIAYAREKAVAEKIDVVTNAALLTPALSDRLVAAGLSTLRVSLEGLSSEEYRENASAAVDFDELVANLRYFYEHAGDTRVYVKIIDYMLRGDPEREACFHSLFDGISHITAVEHLTPTVEGIDYDAFKGDVDFSLTQDGERRGNVRICPQAFYILQCNPDGSLVPCCSTRYPVVETDSDDLLAAWNGETLTRLRLSLLRGDPPEACKTCTLYQFGTYPEDVLDGHETELIEKYSALLKEI